MKLLLILFLFIVLIKIYEKNRENFYGMNYVKQHRYLKCCNAYGCGHPFCRKYLKKNISRLNTIGYLQNNNKLIKLLSRKNYNTNKDDYFIKFKNKQKDVIFNKLDIKQRYLHDGDVIQLDNNKYTVNLYENNMFNFRNRYYDPLYRGLRKDIYVRENRYPIRFNVERYGYIKPNDLNKSDFLLVYRKPVSRNRYEYYVKKNDIMLPIDQYKNKDLYNGDEIELSGYNDKYTFKEFSY